MLKCKDCEYARAVLDGSTDYLCKRHPPQALLSPDGSGMLFVWPRLPSEGECGDADRRRLVKR